MFYDWCTPIYMACYSTWSTSFELSLDIENLTLITEKDQTYGLLLDTEIENHLDGKIMLVIVSLYNFSDE